MAYRFPTQERLTRITELVAMVAAWQKNIQQGQEAIEFNISMEHGITIDHMGCVSSLILFDYMIGVLFDRPLLDKDWSIPKFDIGEFNQGKMFGKTTTV